MWYWILIALAAIAALFVVIVAMRPNQFRVQRSIAIAAPPAAIFAHVNDFRNWKLWSPWAKLDPAMRETYDGPAAGTGAKYYWNGNKQVGEGLMTLTESEPNSAIHLTLEFLRPFASRSEVDFKFEPAGRETNVTWSMTGSHNFLSKAFCMFMNMDRMIGKDFEKGLSQLKSIAEGAPPVSKP